MAVVFATAIAANASFTSASVSVAARPARSASRSNAAAPISPCRRYAAVSAISVAPDTCNSPRDNSAPPAFSFRESASANGVPARYSTNSPASPLSGASACAAAIPSAIAARFFSRPVSRESASASSATAANLAMPHPSESEHHHKDAPAAPRPLALLIPIPCPSASPTLAIPSKEHALRDQPGAHSRLGTRGRVAPRLRLAAPIPVFVFIS